MERRNAVLVGATGLIGGLCLDRLLADTRYARVLSLVRRPTGKRHENLAEHTIDFAALRNVALPPEADLFCCMGSTIKKAGSKERFRQIDLDYPLTLARRGVECSARQFLVVTSVGSDVRSPNFYLQVKGELEDRLRELPLPFLHIFRPSFLLGDRAEARPGERVGQAVSKLIQFALIGSLRKYRPIEAATVAQAMVSAALLPLPGPHVYHFDEIRQLSQRQP